jgi:hypothetical protein
VYTALALLAADATVEGREFLPALHLTMRQESQAFIGRQDQRTLSSNAFSANKSAYTMHATLHVPFGSDLGLLKGTGQGLPISIERLTEAIQAGTRFNPIIKYH